MVRPALAAIACGIAVAAAGCGAGIGPGPREGQVELVVTRDYGRTVVAGPSERQLRSADSVMSLLDEVAEVKTGYGGRFVESIEGIDSSAGARSFDWFYFVNGVEAEVGAASFRPRAGDSVWWDFRDWTEAMYAGAVTGAYPAPLGGTDGPRLGSVRLSCLTVEATCRLVRRALADDGILLSRQSGESEQGQIRVVVGAIGDLERHSADYRLDEGPRSSGVFARLQGPQGRSDSGFIELLDERARVTGRFGAGAGLVAAVRSEGDPPVWLITGTDDRGVTLASSALDPAILRRTYAVVVPPGSGPPQPVPTRPGEIGP